MTNRILMVIGVGALLVIAIIAVIIFIQNQNDRAKAEKIALNAENARQAKAKYDMAVAVCKATSYDKDPFGKPEFNFSAYFKCREKYLGN
jgi:hypothetical protein